MLSSFSDMAGLPKGFKINIGGNPSVATSGKTVSTRPQSKKEGKQATEVKDPSKRKPIHHQVKEDAPSKKRKTTPFLPVSCTLSPLAIPYVKDEVSRRGKTGVLLKKMKPS